jgi:hypothetical protein
MAVRNQLNVLHLRKSLFIGCLVVSSLANAGEGVFGWIYTLDLQPKGSLEFEQRLQLTTGQANGKYDFWYSRSELEYGLTDDIQVAAYLNAYSVDAAQNYLNPEVCGDAISCTSGYGVPDSANEFDGYGKTGLDGGSLEGIWRITNPVTQPIGIGIYLEPTLGKLKNAFESRLLVQSNFIDDRLILAGNLVLENEQLKSTGETIPESMIDILLGASYRFAPKWSGGIEYRYHTDYNSYFWQNQVQTANFIGPNLHYADKHWWATLAWRYQLDGQCMGEGTAECSGGNVWDSHGKNEIIAKIGFPFS